MDVDSECRRRVLRTTVALVTAGVAGCSGGGTSGTDPQSGTANGGSGDGSDDGTPNGGGRLLEDSAFPGEVVRDELAAVRPLTHRAHSNGNVEFSFENVESGQIEVWDDVSEYYIDVTWFDGSDTALSDPNEFRVPAELRLATDTPADDDAGSNDESESDTATDQPDTTASSQPDTADSAGKWAATPPIAVAGNQEVTVTARAPDVDPSTFDHYEIEIERDPVV